MAGNGDGLSRRRFIHGTAATAAVAGAGVSRNGPTRPDARAATPPFKPRGKLTKRPNILLILCDEYRYPVAYESSQLQHFRQQYLTAEESMRENGLEFDNHYIMTAACVPSRTSIFTGQYPSLNGNTQTPGAAKGVIEADMFWLDPNTVPTMGNYFRAGGYDTYYKGKWHVSEEDIHIPGTYNPLLSFYSNGEPDPKTEQEYLNADRLGPYGFSGWIGPEPHGNNPLNSGSSAAGAIGRDEKFATQAVDLINQLAGQGSGKPWLLVNSYVNPHDITVWGAFTLENSSWNLRGQLKNSKVPAELFDPVKYAETSGENLAGKPPCQADYVKQYAQIFQPVPDFEDYRRFYYQLQQNVNEQIQRVLDALNSHPDLAENTIVIFTSDHGDLIGAHGGMHQKWHCMYEEATHVPFIVHNKKLFSGRESLSEITSHADLLPTLLGLAGIDAAKAQDTLKKTHNEVHRQERGAGEVEVLQVLRQSPVLDCPRSAGRAAPRRDDRGQRQHEPARREVGRHDGEDQGGGRRDRVLQPGQGPAGTGEPRPQLRLDHPEHDQPPGDTAAPAVRGQVPQAEQRYRARPAGLLTLPQDELASANANHLLLQELPGHHHALDLVGALVDLDGRRAVASSRR